MKTERNHANSPRSRRQRVLARLRVSGVHTAFAMTALSAFSYAADSTVAVHPPAGSSTTTTKKQAPAAKGPVAALRHLLEIGKASWYGLQFQGKKTATGEKFDMNELTCAHRTLPLGSWLRVTNLHNQKSVLVRVNDRGPMMEDRIIDLSYAAAQAVGIDGMGRVRLEPLSSHDPEVAKVLLAKALEAQLKIPELPVE